MSLPLTVPFALVSLLVFHQQFTLFSALGLLGRVFKLPTE